MFEHTLPSKVWIGKSILKCTLAEIVALKKRKTDKVGMWNWSSSAARGDDLNDWGRVEPLPV